MLTVYLQHYHQSDMRARHLWAVCRLYQLNFDICIGKMHDLTSALQSGFNSDRCMHADPDWHTLLLVLASLTCYMLVLLH